jgi:Predicted endonuclease distantly related to archaeal Holliday junction resolvase
LNFLTKKGTPQPRTAIVGQWGERLAVDFLKKDGFSIIGCNVRQNRHDEIDVIAQKGELLVFVEVKTRKAEEYGRPAMAVDQEKRHKLNRAAAAYLRKAKYPELFYRFDVIEVLGEPEEGDPLEVRHLEDAFPFEKRFMFPVGCRKK